MCLLPYKLFLSAQHEQRIHSKQELEQCSMEMERDGQKKKAYQDEYNSGKCQVVFLNLSGIRSEPVCV